MLPDEERAVEELRPLIQEDLRRSHELLAVVVRCLWRDEMSIRGQETLGLSAVHTVMGLQGKASKTFRAVELVAEHGLGEDAMTLTRSLHETAMAAMFILETDHTVRSWMYHAHSVGQTVKMLNQWRRNPELAGEVDPDVYNRHVDAMRLAQSHLPAGVDVSHHWSGKGSMSEGARSMGGSVWYDLVYRSLSKHAHGTDLASHVEIDPATGEPVFTIIPGDKWVREALRLSAVMFWLLASAINDTFRLDFESDLAKVKPAGLNLKAESAPDGAGG